MNLLTYLPVLTLAIACNPPCADTPLTMSSRGADVVASWHTCGDSARTYTVRGPLEADRLFYGAVAGASVQLTPDYIAYGRADLASAPVITTDSHGVPRNMMCDSDGCSFTEPVLAASAQRMHLASEDVMLHNLVPGYARSFRVQFAGVPAPIEVSGRTITKDGEVDIEHAGDMSSPRFTYKLTAPSDTGFNLYVKGWSK